MECLNVYNEEDGWSFVKLHKMTALRKSKNSLKIAISCLSIYILSVCAIHLTECVLIFCRYFENMLKSYRLFKLSMECFLLKIVSIVFMATQNSFG